MTNENDSDTPATDPQGQPPHQPPVIPAAPPQGEVSPNSNDGSNNQQETARELAREFRWVEGAQLVVNGILAIVGIVALCIYGGQLKVMRGQLGEIVKQYPELQKSATAAKSAADTADATLKASGQQFKIEERPYITIAIFQLTPMPASAGSFHVGLHMINSGKTPALSVKVFARSYVGNRELSLLMPKGRSQVVIGSDKEMENTYTIDFIGTDAQQVTGGTEDFVLKGTVSYTDIFTDPHPTDFCMRYYPKENNYKYCQTGNDVR